ncbi:lactate utilization protein [Desulfosporosinus sp.]|uniref:LutC/YkgG family protein n=1 Tax=Desulfosporosinus sp. TaxID=157907 RepID=UPI0025BA9323|nr:lactate utilization protein [Desulfosporosinus sp.]MBC2722214.1 lactate utilization protein [Desulfosporosinus sp.]MBC2728552.1 lactate utilization protein [Desulfosporosinus sp.]
MTTTKHFINGLASKLGRPTPTKAPTPVEISVPQYRLSNTEERVSIFLQNWHALGGKGAIVRSENDLLQSLQEWFGDQPINWIKENKLALLAWDMLPPIAESAFSSLNWPLTRYTQSSLNIRDRYSIAAQAELGVTGSDWGIALSGTIVTNSNPLRGRAISLLPPRHLAFIEAAKIRNNLFEVLHEVSALGTPPAAIEMISGPSRTSDIEMDLSIGVHGPIEVYAVVIQD